MGTPLSAAFGALDADGSGFITVEELERGLKDMGVFDAMPRDQVVGLLRRIKSTPGSAPGPPGDGGAADDPDLISLRDLMIFVGREYCPTEAAEARLRKVLLKAEKNGTNLEDAFKVLDKDKNGKIPLTDLDEGLRGLGVFEGIPPSQVSLTTRRMDRNGDGTVSLREFLAFAASRPYSVNDSPLEAKLRRVVQKAEAMGTSMEDAFSHFDKDGSGSITPEGFSEGLREMGVFDDFSDEEVQQVVRRFDTDGDGSVSLPEFLRFLGREYKAGKGIAPLLLKILRKTEELGTSIEESFKGLGPNDAGIVTADSLHNALQEIGQFRYLTLKETRGFVRLFAKPHAQGAVVGWGGKGSENGSSCDSFGIALEDFKHFVKEGTSFLTALQHEAARPAITLSSGPKEVEIVALSSSKVQPSPPFWGVDRREKEGGGKGVGGPTNESVVLQALRSALHRAERGVRGAEFSQPARRNIPKMMAQSVLESFDADDDGRLGPQELGYALRSLGARPEDFGGPGALQILEDRFGGWDGNRRGVGGVQIEELLKWHHEGCRERARGRDGGDEHGSGDGGGRGTNGRKESSPRRLRNTDSDSAVVASLRAAVRASEARGLTMERTFARLDNDGDGRITLKEFLRGLDQMDVFQRVTREDALDVLECMEEEGHGGPRKGGAAEDDDSVGLVDFIRFIRKRPSQYRFGCGGEVDEVGDTMAEKLESAGYDFSTDPDTREAEKRLQKIVGKQVDVGFIVEMCRKGRVDVEAVFSRYDPEESGSVPRSDFVQALMELGVGILDHYGGRSLGGGETLVESDPVRRRQLAQLARTKGPIDRRLLRMRRQRQGLFLRKGGYGRDGNRGLGDGKGWEGKENENDFQDEDESLALIQWYREGQKKSMVRHILTFSLTSEYNLYFAFGSPLYFEHPLRNPFSHEERFTIDLADHQLRVVTRTEEWQYLRSRHVTPCVGQTGDLPVESDFFDIDPGRGVQVTLSANELVYIPFAFLSLEPTANSVAVTESAWAARQGKGPGTERAERSSVVAFVSASHGHVVNMMQVHCHRRPFSVDRTFRFYQNEGEILKRFGPEGIIHSCLGVRTESTVREITHVCFRVKRDTQWSMVFGLGGHLSLPSRSILGPGVPTKNVCCLFKSPIQLTKPRCPCPHCKINPTPPGQRE
ncbi:unnamed protein product [Discosporangium mesarthrocarpum]